MQVEVKLNYPKNGTQLDETKADFQKPQNLSLSLSVYIYIYIYIYLMTIKYFNQTSILAWFAQGTNL